MEVESPPAPAPAPAPAGSSDMEVDSPPQDVSLPPAGHPTPTASSPPATSLQTASLHTPSTWAPVHAPPPASPPNSALPASQASTSAPPASKASSQFYQPGPDPRNHLLYFDLVVPNALTVGSDLVGSYRLSLVRVVEELYKVDNTISLFPYGKPDSDESIILKMGSSLGDSLSQLSNYFDGLRLT